MALREIAAEFDIRVTGADKLKELGKEVDKESEGLGEFGEKLHEFANIAAEAFAFKELGEFVRGQAELGEQLEHTALKIGISIENLQRLQYAAGQSGLEAERLTSSLGKLEMQLGKGGDSPAAQALAKLRIRTKDTAGKSRELTDILLDTADKVAETADPFKRSAIAVQLFGREGKELLPFLLKGRDGIQELMKEADDLGVVLGEDFTASARKAVEEQRKLEWSTRALKASLGQELFPAFRAIVDKVTEGVGWFKELAKHTTIVSTGLSALGFAAGFKLFGSLSKLMGFAKGGGILGQLFGMGKLAAILVGIALLYLAWDELFGLFTGKKTVIGDIIDKVYGKGESEKGINDMKQAWKDIVEAISGAKVEGDALSAWWGTFVSTVVTGGLYIGKVLGTAFGTLVAYGGELAASFANVWAQVTGSDADKKKAQYNLDIANKASERMEDQLADAIKGVGMKWFQPVGYAGNIEPTAKGLGYGVPGGMIGPPRPPAHITVHQTNHINSDNPATVKSAIHQGTTSALSQTDLRNAYQASRSAGPAQLNTTNPMGNP